ncbi:MAG: helix-turn-helix transcriptional regulator [Brevundimonas sp.]|uniref:helix-turn-helix domain-containing protein n=1 Tax=Brevundimonas sp. TaxID=1871086 RepID=UPI0025C11A7B|nr:helix-turn-helix transcriptional regulator [Brevundimonas sp.]MBX3476238.1 helix-turn-helix transcriptional regulator [Brevundimonas sp.]
MPAKQTALQHDVVVSPAQLRAARGLLNWSVSQLAEATGLAMNTVRKAENARDYMSVYKPNAQLLRKTLEDEGVVFIDADDMGAGARLRDPVEPQGSRRSVS